jgi:hypothetical protein
MDSDGNGGAAMLRTIGIVAAVAWMLGSATVPAFAADDVAERFTRIARSLDWQLVETVAVQFPTHHPQGMTIRIATTSAAAACSARGSTPTA